MKKIQSLIIGEIKTMHWKTALRNKKSPFLLEYRRALSRLNLRNVTQLIFHHCVYRNTMRLLDVLPKLKYRIHDMFYNLSAQLNLITSPNKNEDTIYLLLPTFYELTSIFKIHLAIGEIFNWLIHMAMCGLNCVPQKDTLKF